MTVYLFNYGMLYMKIVCVCVCVPVNSDETIFMETVSVDEVCALIKFDIHNL